MRKLIICLLLLFCMLNFSCEKEFKLSSNTGELCSQYIKAWKSFYPSRAYSRGFLESIFLFEDYSAKQIDKWIFFNQNFLEKVNALGPDLPQSDRIDLRLLKTQIKQELKKWEEEKPHINSISFYSRLVSQAIPRILESELLLPDEKYRIISKRLDDVSRICAAAEQMLENGSPKSMERSLAGLERAAAYYGEEVPEIMDILVPSAQKKEFAAECHDTAARIRGLISYIKENIFPNLTLSDSQILGREKYSGMLKLYADIDLTPEQLEKMALEEIQTVRKMMADLSLEYFKEAYPARKVPEDIDSLVKRALSDMEKNHPAGEQEYLHLLRGFAKEAEEFVREKKIATIPAHQTLSIELAPESSGPMARIGFVQPAPPFHPNPWTTWNLATIPDTHPQKEREEFWRSFNNHFKKFIVIHELFPGHYIQTKIARENPHHVRVLFPYGLYSEGWATLCERVALDAGWDNGNKLTRLAQLRKRLENANRAYTSVQAHCNGWEKEKILDFSIQTSLLAPQFAKSLWGRLMRSPMQITSYFLGNQMFTEVYKDEMKRRGDEFCTLEFMDTILRAGPIPLDEFPELFKAKQH